MENMELKNLELTDDQLEQANGGTTNGGTTNGNGHELFFPSNSLINDENVSVEPIEEVTSSIP